MDLFGGKVSVALMAASAAGSGVVNVVVNTERVILNVPLSVLFVAIAGALIGVLILPAKDAARVSSDHSAALWRRLLVLAARAAMLAAMVLAYAFMAAWTVQAVALVIKLATAVTIPLTGIAGAFIRPLLPKYLQGVEGITERLLGKVGST
jgi:hypothetical protein